MRHRDRWERRLRAEIESATLPEGVDRVTAWAVATLLASYADPNGANIEVSLATLRRQLGMNKTKLNRTVKWLADSGFLAVTAQHGFGVPNRRSLTVPQDHLPLD